MISTTSYKLAFLFLTAVIAPSIGLAVASLYAVRYERNVHVDLNEQRATIALVELSHDVAEAAYDHVGALRTLWLRGSHESDPSAFASVFGAEATVVSYDHAAKVVSRTGGRFALEPELEPYVRDALQSPPERGFVFLQLDRAPPHSIAVVFVREVNPRTHANSALAVLFDLEAWWRDQSLLIERAQRLTGLLFSLEFSASKRAQGQARLSRTLPPPFARYRLRAQLAHDHVAANVFFAGEHIYVWGIVLIVVVLLIGALVVSVAVYREIRTSALKSDFVTTVTHELKTPLTSIGMFAETLLMDRVRGDNERKECLEIIVRETDRLSRLIDRVLTFSKIEAQKKRFELRLTNLAEVVAESIDLFNTQMREANPPVQADLVMLQELEPVLCDRAGLQEVLLNLLSNAYKYGGSTRLDSADGDGATRRRPRRIRITVTKRRRWAMIAVQDWGIGIGWRDRRKVFGKFYRANDVLTRDVEGSGIGLALVRSIMRANRGDVTVKSSVGQGSTFTVWLPR